MSHSQGFSNNIYLEMNHIPRIDIYIFKIPILIFCSPLCLNLPRGLFPLGLPLQVLLAFLSSFFQAACPVHLIIIIIIIIIIIVNVIDRLVGLVVSVSDT